MAAMNTPAAMDQSVYKQPLDFIDIYHQNIFGGVESRSGNGSTLVQTAVIRDEIPLLFKELNIKSVLDAPCGDFNWMKEIMKQYPNIKYTGLDIVPDLIETNTESYASNTVNFRVGNIVTDDLPQADVIICRDCLVHMPVEHALKAVEKFRKSGAKYLLCTTFTGREKNEEQFIRGLWRALNMEKQPFDLGPARRLINENCTEAGDFLADKCLGLWHLQETAC
jgi:2-polyprenyl-3-methyl-5-hydroxy-6-metoxy-1,4-benzoquinol methylase